MSIQNVPHTAGHSIILDPASFTLAQAPSRLPADTYDLVVSLGTDYHTFDRLLRWVKAYLAENPQVRCLIQHGIRAHIECAILHSSQRRGDTYVGVSVVRKDA